MKQLLRLNCKTNDSATPVIANGQQNGANIQWEWNPNVYHLWLGGLTIAKVFSL